MKNLLIVANWKENKTKNEAMDWFGKFKGEEVSLENKEIVVCPSYTLLAKAKYLISENNLEIKIGAQDVSRFEKGAYTGEVSATQIKEFADYVIIGHSERRKNFAEDDEMLEKKVSESTSFSLIPIFCVSSSNMEIPQGVTIVAYEPIEAIGTGNPDTPENANFVAKEIKNSNQQVLQVLYGGSVTAANVNSFTKMENIDGVLVGGASLDASTFLEITKNA